jgi:hypothetical protein
VTSVIEDGKETFYGILSWGIRNDKTKTTVITDLKFQIRVTATVAVKN